jgi:hypothetical protein
MDGFETIVAAILEHQNYWVRRNLRLELPIEKRRTRSSPRPELDIVAYSPADNELLVVECKSWLNSAGVKAKHFEPGSKAIKRYRLFLDPDPVYWKAVREGLIGQLKLGNLRPNVRRCLVAGKVPPSDLQRLKDKFQEEDWIFHDPDWVCAGLEEFQKSGYQNDAVVMAVKLLATRNSSRRHRSE